MDKKFYASYELALLAKELNFKFYHNYCYIKKDNDI